MSEFEIQPSGSSVSPGKAVFVVRNTGKIRHQLTVIRTPTLAGKVLAHGVSDDTLRGKIAEIDSLAPGASKTLHLHLKAGHYALVCNLPGHYKAGMYRDITVT